MTAHSLKGCSYDPDGAESEAPKYESKNYTQNLRIKSMLKNTDVKYESQKLQNLRIWEAPKYA